jgi:hypothetical protein
MEYKVERKNELKKEKERKRLSLSSWLRRNTAWEERSADGRGHERNTEAILRLEAMMLVRQRQPRHWR